MPTPPRPSLSGLRLSVLALSLVIGGASLAQAPVTAEPESVRRLATDDPQVQASRWGTLALMAGKPWLTAVPGEIATVWRLASWVVPGASMRFQRGFCAATACQSTDYVVQFDDKAGQLQFFDNGTMAYTGHVEADGALRMKGTGLLGVLTAETLRHDPATGTLYANAHPLKAGTPQQLAGATGGFAPAAAAAAHLSSTTASATAPAPAADADLRAELAAMKAKVDQLSRQLEQQPAPARPPTPAEARAKAAEEKRQAEARAREEKQAKAAEAQRLAAERKARAEQEKREQAEARAREVEARAAEAKRQAEERRAREEAARRQADEQRARQEAERREAAERSREAEAARAAQAAAARQQAAAQPSSPPPRPAPAEGPVRPGLYSSGTGYEVDVKLVGDSLVLTERAYNRTSEYRPTSPGSRVYGYRNPNTGTHFALTVQDNTTLVASRFSGSGEVLPNGTPLRFAGGAAEAQPVSRSTFTAMEERAQHYLRLAQTDPSNAQAWSFCGMAAMAQAHGQNEAQVRQAAMALKSIATTARSPCGEVITDALWRSLP